MRILLCAVGAIVASLLSSCGSNNNNTTPANIRLVNTTSASVTMTLNGAYALADIASNGASGYETVPPGTYTVSVADVQGQLSSTPQTVGVATAQAYTTLAYERGNVISSYTITDNLAVPAAGFSTIDVANISPDAGPVDVYLLPSGTTSLTNLSPSFSSVQGLTTAASLVSGTYNIVVTGAGSQTDIRFSLLTGVTFASQQVGTLVLTGTPGGTLVNLSVVTQGGSVVAFPVTQARVRVMSAVPTAVNAAVAVTVGTTVLTTYAPNPTPYTLVDGGSAIASISVTPSGLAAYAPAVIPTSTFTAGQDYSILVYGDGATAAGTFAVVLADNNLIIPNQASVRLVNAGVTAAGGVTMYVAGTQAASGTAYGTASPYAGVRPASASQVVLNGSGYTPPTVLWGPVSGTVSTVFVYTSVATVPPLIFTDR